MLEELQINVEVLDFPKEKLFRKFSLSSDILWGLWEKSNKLKIMNASAILRSPASKPQELRLPGISVCLLPLKHYRSTEPTQLSVCHLKALHSSMKCSACVASTPPSKMPGSKPSLMRIANMANHSVAAQACVCPWIRRSKFNDPMLLCYQRGQSWENAGRW